jgi:hypothetical protein
MKYKHVILLLSLLQQNNIQAKSSAITYIKSLFTAEEPTQKIIHKEYKEAIDHLTIVHGSGNVVIQTWKQLAVALEIVHRGTEHYVEETHTAIMLFENRLSLTTESTLKSNNSTDLHIIIPEKTTVKINTQRGNITVSHSDGKLDLYTEQGNILVTQGDSDLVAKTSQGNITVYRDKNNSDSSIDLVAERGNIALYTTTTSDLDIDAQTLKGRIESAIPVTLHALTMKINSKNIADLEKKISGSIGKPLSKIKLFCYTGNIKIESYL